MSPVPSTAALSTMRPLRSGQLVDPRRDERPQRAGQLGVAAAGRQPGQLDEEQRVAAAAVDELATLRSVDSAPALRSSTPQTSSVASSMPSGPSGTCSTSGRSTVGGHDEVGVGALGGDEQEREVRQRADDDPELVAQHRVGPVQVVERTGPSSGSGRGAAPCR